MSEVNYFNIRVYALIINSRQEILIAEEFHYGTFMRKFPGGGLIPGEGIRAALFRELEEELQIVPENVQQFYTIEDFIQSAFNRLHQVVGVYYLVKAPESIDLLYREAYTLPEAEGEEKFRWTSLSRLQESDFTFEPEKTICRLLIDYFKSSRP